MFVELNIEKLNILPTTENFKTRNPNYMSEAKKKLFVKLTLLTYIHNSPLQAYSQDYGLASHITNVVCINFIRESW